MNKLKQWIKSTGLTNLGYLAAFVAAWVFGFKMAAGAFIGVFIYLNWNALRKSGGKSFIASDGPRPHPPTTPIHPGK